MKEFLLGVLFGCLLLVFIAWVDNKYLSNVKIVNMKLNTKRSLYFNYIMGSAYEIMFFVIGFLLGGLK